MTTKPKRKVSSGKGRAKTPSKTNRPQRGDYRTPVQRQKSIEEIRMRHEKKQRKKRRRRRMFRTFVVCLLLIIALLCVVFLTPFFLVDNIAVEGNRHVKQTEILTTAAIDKGQNSFSLNTGRIEKRLETIPYVKTAKISRKLPKGIVIHISERSIYCYIKVGESFYAIDKEGIVLETPNKLDAHYPCVDGIEVEKGEIGQKIVLKKPTQLKAFVAVMDAAKSQKIAVDLSEVNVKDPENIVFLYQGRITVNFGDDSEAERKMMYLAAVGNSEQRNGSIRFDMDNGKTYFTAE